MDTQECSTKPRTEVQHIREVSAHYSGPRRPTWKIRSAEDVDGFCRKVVKDNAREHFFGLFLDGEHKVIGYSLVGLGTANLCPVHPRELFQPAILLGSVAVVISHNHPSGQLEPSEEDVRVTRMLREAGLLLGIEVLDHVIFTDDGYISLKDGGHFA